jgi:3-oxoacyl-[acyl-carrier protein] reductase
VVVGYNRSEEAAQLLVQTLEKSDGSHLALRVPVTDTKALAAVSAQIAELYGRCDILVNCHGTTRFVAHSELDALDDSLFDEVMSTNVRGAFATVRALRPLLANISSISATLGLGSNIAYCASKAALDTMTKSMARALAPEIRVMSVAPGLVKTDFTNNFDPVWIENYLRITPLKRMVPPEDIASAVIAAAVYLPSSTGIVLPVDAGRLLA